jgi:hypothetical protein
MTKQSSGDFDNVFLLVLIASLVTLLLSLFMREERSAVTPQHA